MRTSHIVFGIVALVTVTLGAGGVATFDTTPVVHSNCVVTEKKETYMPKAGMFYDIDTENCGELSAKENVMDDIVEGETYDFTATGWWSWAKMVSEFTAK